MSGRCLVFQDAGFGFLADAPAARKMRIKWR
jgi:hypothetical protein